MVSFDLALLTELQGFKRELLFKHNAPPGLSRRLNHRMNWKAASHAPLRRKPPLSVFLETTYFKSALRTP
jgi:hypothetical protein